MDLFFVNLYFSMNDPDMDQPVELIVVMVIRFSNNTPSEAEPVLVC